MKGRLLVSSLRLFPSFSIIYFGFPSSIFILPAKSMAKLPLFFFFFFIIQLCICFPFSLSQSTAASEDSCNGIFLSYTYISGNPIPPNLTISDPPHQPYKFESNLTILNNGLRELKSWRVFVGFQHGEVLVSAPNAVLDDGSSLPAQVGNSTVFAGFPQRDLKTAVETAGNFNQMRVEMLLVGTQFGVAAPDFPLPSTITLANDGFSCPNPTKSK